MFNTAIGYSALFSDTIGNENAATGYGALGDNITGSQNTANGAYALHDNTFGSRNTAIGNRALVFNTTGVTNTATGFAALYNNTTGQNNIALGYGAGINLTTGNNNIDIGNAGVADESNTIRIGGQTTQTSTFIAGISGTAVSGVPVVVDGNGQLGVLASSERFKDEIKPMDTASEAILALRPVTFRYKHELDPSGTPQFGLVAEEVEKVNPDLVARDAQGKVFSVRYEAVNAMLLNEFLKEHRTVEELKATITQLKAAALKQEAVNAELKTAALKQETTIGKQEATITRLKAGIEVLTASLKKQEALIQKVSAELEMSKPAPRTVDNNQ
jgi:hypothetical protein